MPSQKKLEKDATKAYKKAKDAVDDAKRLAVKVQKKAGAKKAAAKKTAKVDALTSQLSESKPTAKKAAVPESGPGVTVFTPPLPAAHLVHEPVEGGGTADIELGAQTIIALRTLAKSRGLTGYTRLSKSALIEHIEKASASS